MSYPVPILPNAPNPEHEIRMHVSVSQIETFASCQRKWAFGYLWGHKPPATPSKTLGTAVHSQLERYAQGHPLDLDTDAGCVALPLVQFLPRPEILIAGEREQPLQITPAFQREHFGIAYNWIGFRDLLLFDDSGATQIDYKTLGDFRYCHTPETLADDIQQNVYAFDLFGRGFREITSAWLYTRTKGSPDARSVTFVPGFRETLGRMGSIMKLAGEITAIKQRYLNQPFTPNTLEPNPETCNAYGGCPYKKICGLSPLKGLGDQIMAQGLSLAEIMRQRSQAGAAQEPAPQQPAQIPHAVLPPEANQPPPQFTQPPGQPPQAPSAAFPPGFQMPMGMPPTAASPAQASPVPGFPPFAAQPPAQPTTSPSGAVVSPVADPTIRRPGRPRKGSTNGTPETSAVRETVATLGTPAEELALAAFAFVHATGASYLTAGASPEQIAQASAAFAKTLLQELGK